MSKHNLIRLKNGLTLILEQVSTVRSVSVSIGVRAGSRYETKETAGLAHFLEHMLFEGTKLFPTAKKLAEQIEKVGGYSGAYTDREYVIYHVKVFEKHLELAFEYLSQIIFDSTLELNNIEKEKSIVLEEIKRVMDNPEQAIWEEWMKWVWGEDQPLGRSVLGDKDTVQNITGSKLRTYLQDLYVPQNMILTVVGNFSLLKAKEYVQKYFNVKMTGKISALKRIELPKRKIQTKVVNSDTQQVQLVCGFITGVSYSHKDRFVMRLLAEILSGGVSARIFQKLIYELGIAYSAGAYSMEFKDTGISFIFGGFAKENIEKAITTIFDELREINTKSVSSDELISAKERSIAKLYFSAEKPDYLADLYATQFATEGEMMTIEELSEQINKVSSMDIKRVMQKYFNNSDAYIILRGPVGQDQVEIIDKIRDKIT
ncbi:insulinase family protein [Patescibacteria group bacterium]|nr:insulinase family protein [Patescibacteria group bacterium]